MLPFSRRVIYPVFLLTGAPLTLVGGALPPAPLGHRSAATPILVAFAGWAPHPRGREAKWPARMGGSAPATDNTGVITRREKGGMAPPEGWPNLAPAGPGAILPTDNPVRTKHAVDTDPA